MSSLLQIEEDAYQSDLGFSTGQLGKGGIGGPVRGPAVDKKTQVTVSKRLQVSGGGQACWGEVLRVFGMLCTHVYLI